MSDEEKNMSFQEYTAHIMRKGEVRGAERERQSIITIAAERERQSIISFAAGLLPPQRIEQLQSIQDLDLLTTAIKEALREQLG